MKIIDTFFWSIIVVPMKEIVENIYQLLSHSSWFDARLAYA